jgi:hypothetical protein
MGQTTGILFLDAKLFKIAFFGDLSATQIINDCKIKNAGH